MNVIKRITIATVAAACWLAGGAAMAEELKMGLVTPPAHVWTKAAQRFADTLKARSNGELTVAVFPGAQLGAEPEMFQQMQSGLLDMGIMTGALTSLRVPSMQGWFTPFLFRDVEHAAAAARTPAAQKILDDLEKVNLKGLGYSFAGMRHILKRSGTVATLADLKGQKVRIVPFPAMKAWWGATGAVPTPVQLPDVYQALQNGLLDGVDIDLDALVGSKFHEVGKGLTLTSHMAFPAVAMVAKPRWEKLSPAHRKLIADTMAETLAWATTEQIAAEKRNLATVKAAITVTELSDPKAKFAAANAAVDALFGSHELIAAFRQQVTAGK